ncbi:sensor histidine kinase [Sediminibacterium salmoneum]|uniref:sensor histidine kinase n=1 Tax=Sediminibacterium salmoneum TaxID=426421 RepID=UPI0004B8B4D8|nr:histidine kinase [Sediminibacterium salmoneum]
MKNFVIFLFFLINSSHLFAQNDFSKITGIIHKFPVIVKSNNHLFSFDYKDSFKIQTGRLQLFLFKGGINYQFDQLIEVDLPKKDKKQIRIAILDDKYAKQKLRFLNITGIKKDQILDTTLYNGNTLTVVWINQQSQILQKIVFSCSNLFPSVIGFRTLQNVDHINQFYKASRLNRDTTFPKEFKKSYGNLIRIRSLENLELLIPRPNLLKDSVLQFRFFDQSTAPKAKWVNTGHLITLKDVKPGNSYFLEIKYIGQTDSCLIEIVTDKEIYQEGWFLAILFVFICLLIIWAVKWYYKRRIANLIAQRNRVEDKLKMVQSQLNPHFVFNALSSIEGLISNGENELASQYLANFSTILRETLKNSDRLLISLEEEISLIDKYCKVEQLRFGFNYNVSINQSINVTSIEVLPLLIQPIVENAVKHGLAGLKEKGYLEIMLQRDVNDLVIIIKNNHTVIKTNTGTAGGYGLRYLQERLDHFNLLNKGNHIVYDFELLMDSATATVRFSNWLL